MNLINTDGWKPSEKDSCKIHKSLSKDNFSPMKNNMRD
jgi:hypothetical protein